MASLRPDLAVSVVIPHFDDLAGLRTCWDALRLQSLDPRRFEVVVADNNSTCGIDAVRRAAPGVRVVPAPLQGAGLARNAGAGATSAPVIAFLDSDCVPDSDWLAQGLEALEGYDFIGGQVIAFAETQDSPNPVEAFEIVFSFNFRRYVERVGFTGTGNMFVKRAVFERVGGFRAGVSEDMEWSFRARAMGFRLGYAERAVVGHPARKTWAELTRRWSRMLAEDLQLARETRFGALRYALKAAAMPLSIIPHAIVVGRSAKLPGSRAKVGAALVLARLRLWRTRKMLELALRDTAARGQQGSGQPSRAEQVRSSTRPANSKPPNKTRTMPRLARLSSQSEQSLRHLASSAEVPSRGRRGRAS